MQVCQALMARDEVMVRRAMADVLTRLFRRLTFDAIPFFDKLRQDEDENVLAAVSSTSGDLRFLDTDLWANTLVELSNHKLPVVRRNIVPSFGIISERFQKMNVNCCRHYGKMAMKWCEPE